MLKKLSAVLALVFGLVGTSNAELWDRGGGLIYDDVLDITWLQDANYAATKTFGVPGIEANGVMSWYTANDWIDATPLAVKEVLRRTLAATMPGLFVMEMSPPSPSPPRSGY